MSNADVGSFACWISHSHPDWATNDAGYNFQPVTSEGITVYCAKHADKKLEVVIAGPFSKTFRFIADIPPCGPKGVFLVLTWQNQSVTLLLNNVEIETRRATDPEMEIVTHFDSKADTSLKILELAVAFDNAAQELVGNLMRLGYRSREAPLRMVPPIVCDAFATELYLKCLYFLDKKAEAPFTHKLKKLFDELDPQTQARIRTIYDDWQSTSNQKIDHPKDGRPMSFDDVLSQCNEAFVEFRYMYQAKNFLLWVGSGLRHSAKLAVQERFKDLFPAGQGK